MLAMQTSIAIDINFTANKISAIFFFFAGKFPVLFPVVFTILQFVTEFLILNYVLFWGKQRTRNLIQKFDQGRQRS